MTISPNHTPSETRIPPDPSADVTVRVFGRTDVGRTREHNEDAFLVADLTTGETTLTPEVREHVTGERGTLFMVADGMGGAAAGELASSMAVEVVVNELRERWLNPEGATEVVLKKRTLTNLYNACPTWLQNAHAALDRAQRVDDPFRVRLDRADLHEVVPEQVRDDERAPGVDLGPAERPREQLQLRELDALVDALEDLLHVGAGLD